MNRTLFVFSLLVSLIVFTPLAFADSTPSGSYTQSCTNIRQDGRDLVADCKDINGNFVTTTLPDFIGCKPGKIDNINGHLECDRQ